VTTLPGASAWTGKVPRDSVVTVQFVGSGDAFGTDGRFQACISVRYQGWHGLLDCGASSLIALKRLGLDVGSIDAVVVSHLHGDHFGGIPFLILDQQFSRRERSLMLAGPRGLQQRLSQATEALFPGSSSVQRRFELRVLELADRTPTQVGPAAVTAMEVLHHSGAPALGLRIRCGNTVVAYSGDTEWTGSMLELARDADLFVCEGYTYDRSIKYHMSYSALAAHRTELTCKRLILSHLGPDLLAHRCEVEAETEIAADGLQLEI
jgi:ribonuclease BN (tRNA processing enzyme)